MKKSHTQAKKTEVQGFIRVDGGYHIGVYMLATQVNLKLGLNINDNTRVFLGGSYAWGKYKQYIQYIANVYIGIGWIPILFDSPVRYMLDSYLVATFGVRLLGALIYKQVAC